ncbi:MAG: tRNA guanosine(34) transglycosylase Tgt, partial [Desulfovibrio sp.]|nr:tRNA guanosine(34) transglycosylase Tgt [Desulfovibrio sp.]
MGQFRLHAPPRNEGGQARRGSLVTAHGVIETPVFMPVGTQGSVKSLCPL